ncbi:putative protein kinase CAMK-OST1L family [Rosa chinensis]|uniref:non-specific serine/threonine protein kinase n=1 Tax=Rosa chinensis TaxID=74649 RepID=A0A2P6PRD8_ROSCH|nr:putative protein kinase CAMK-OST1L family [Rosa chinensis]
MQNLDIDENVQREIMNHRSLKHPNIVEFKEVLLTPTHLGIVMEYAEQGELYERICKAGKFSEGEISDVWSCGITLFVMIFGAYPFEDLQDPLNFTKTIRRITIPEIKSHPWFVKNLPMEMMEGGSWKSNEVNNPSQSVEEVQSIIQQARRPLKISTVNRHLVGSSTAIDDAYVGANAYPLDSTCRHDKNPSHAATGI